MHTKGNWEAQQQKNLVSGKYEWVIKVKEDDVKSRVIATTPYAVKFNDHEANAHLISAVPEMYEALKEVELTLATKLPKYWTYQSYQAIEQALAKAEGRE